MSSLFSIRNLDYFELIYMFFLTSSDPTNSFFKKISDHELCRACSPHQFCFLLFWPFSIWLSLIECFSYFCGVSLCRSLYLPFFVHQNPCLKKQEKCRLKMEEHPWTREGKEKMISTINFSFYFILFFLFLSLLFELPWHDKYVQILKEHKMK